MNTNLRKLNEYVFENLVDGVLDRRGVDASLCRPREVVLDNLNDCNPVGGKVVC